MLYILLIIQVLAEYFHTGYGYSFTHGHTLANPTSGPYPHSKCGSLWNFEEHWLSTYPFFKKDVVNTEAVLVSELVICIMFVLNWSHAEHAPNVLPFPLNCSSSSWLFQTNFFTQWPQTRYCVCFVWFCFSSNSLWMSIMPVKVINSLTRCEIAASWSRWVEQKGRLTPSMTMAFMVCSRRFFRRNDCKMSMMPRYSSKRSPLELRAGIPPGLHTNRYD